MRTAKRIAFAANTPQRDVLDGLQFRFVPNLGTPLTKVNFRSVAGMAGAGAAADGFDLPNASIPKEAMTVNDLSVIEQSPVKVVASGGQNNAPQGRPDETDETTEFLAVPGSKITLNLFPGGAAGTYVAALIFEPNV